MDENEKSDIGFELLKETDKFEISSVKDIDLMKIRCFATHEGLNANGTSFTREMLLECYPSFIDKPLILVEDVNGRPTGHGFNYDTRTFNTEDRKNVGHIINAIPCVVDDTGVIQDVSNIQLEDFPEGEFRIICDLVVYKYYLREMSEILLDLHANGMLNFSMEGLMDCWTDLKGIRHCTNIQFTGLTIVRRPAFINSYSLEVAEKKEGGNNLDFEKMYNELKASNDTLISDHATAVSELASVKSDLETKKTELAELKGVVETKDVEIAEAQDKISELTPFKEQVEVAAANALGQKRHDRLAKLGYTAKSVEELSTMDQATYSALLEDALDAVANKKKKTPENAENQDSFIGVIDVETGFKSNKDRLAELLSDFSKK